MSTSATIICANMSREECQRNNGRCSTVKQAPALYRFALDSQDLNFRRLQLARSPDNYRLRGFNSSVQRHVGLSVSVDREEWNE
jgi:hypothetical protein